MPDGWLTDTRDSYDTDAEGYAEQVRGLLERNPYLRAGLRLFADLVRDAGGGMVADVGCGPGHVTRYLVDLGVDAFGIDLSPEMVALARRDHPGLRFEVGTMTDLDPARRSRDLRAVRWHLALRQRQPHVHPRAARSATGAVHAVVPESLAFEVARRLVTRPVTWVGRCLVEGVAGRSRCRRGGRCGTRL